MIVKRGNKFAVKSKGTNRTLGVHKSREEALAQLGAIEASKARRRRS